MTEICVILKPDTVEGGFSGRVLAAFEWTFKLVDMIMTTPTKPKLRAHYEHVFSRPFYPEMERWFLDGKIIIARMSGPDDAYGTALRIREQLRACFGADGFGNWVHTSDSAEAAERELGIWFGPNYRIDKEC